jgi:hypothetical protein
MNVHNSALKHGIAREDAIHAAHDPLWVDYLDEESPARQLRIGFDRHHRLLETVVLVFDDNEELIIHAMKIRPSVLGLLPSKLL